MSHRCPIASVQGIDFEVYMVFEHLTFNQVVPGSNPGTLSRKNPHRHGIYQVCEDFLICYMYLVFLLFSFDLMF